MPRLSSRNSFKHTPNNSVSSYCSLPTLSYQDMDKLYEAIISEFPDLREQFFNHMTGSFTVTPLSIEYLCKFEEDKEKLVVLQALHCLLAAKETIDSINTLISFTRVPKRADTFQIPESLGFCTWKDPHCTLLSSLRRLKPQTSYIW